MAFWNKKKPKQLAGYHDLPYVGWCKLCLAPSVKLYRTFGRAAEYGKDADCRVCFSCRMQISQEENRRVKRIREMVAMQSIAAKCDPYRGRLSVDPSELWDSAKKIEAQNPYRMTMYDDYVDL